MLYNILLIVQIAVALGIIGLVLIQHGKGADAGAAFGGGASGTVFGSKGAGNFLSRATAVLALVFFLNSLALAWLVRNSGATDTESLVESQAASVVEKKQADVPAPKADVPNATPQADVPATEEPSSGAGATDEQSDVPK